MTDDEDAEAQRRSDRRAFLKRLTGEAVQAAGTIAGTTGIVMRSAAAAGEAAAEGLGIREPVEPAEPAAGTPTLAPASGEAQPSSPAAPPPQPLRPLTDRETELLGAATAVVAVNNPDGVPHLTRAPFHWDGGVARLLGQLFGARIANIERDGHISVLVEDAGGWLTLIGEATVVAGPAAPDEAAPLLAHLHPDLTTEAAWAARCQAGEQAVIVLRPTRVVSQPG